MLSRPRISGFQGHASSGDDGDGRVGESRVAFSVAGPPDGGYAGMDYPEDPAVSIFTIQHAKGELDAYWDILVADLTWYRISGVSSDIVTHTNQDEKDTTQPTILHHILDSDLPAQEKAIGRLVHEARAIVFAGSESTAWALSVSSFHITDDPQFLQKLRAELSETMPDPAVPPTWSQVEQLRYLNAVIKEAVRLSYGLATCNPRLFHTPI